MQHHYCNQLAGASGKKSVGVLSKTLEVTPLSLARTAPRDRRLGAVQPTGER